MDGKPRRKAEKNQMERRFSALRAKAPATATALDSIGMRLKSSDVCDIAREELREPNVGARCGICILLMSRFRKIHTCTKMSVRGGY